MTLSTSWLQEETEKLKQNLQDQLDRLMVQLKDLERSEKPIYSCSSGLSPLVFEIDNSNYKKGFSIESFPAIYCAFKTITREERPCKKLYKEIIFGL